MTAPVIKSACRDDRAGHVEYLTMGGDRFVIDHRGWVLDQDLNPIPHPLVDQLMTAVVAWERE